MVEYVVLNSEEQDDIIVSFMLAQERDRYCHELNIARYTAMLKDIKQGKWRDNISKLLQESQDRLAEVVGIIDATKSQMPPSDRIEAAKLRLKQLNEGRGMV